MVASALALRMEKLRGACGGFSLVTKNCPSMRSLSILVPKKAMVEGENQNCPAALLAFLRAAMLSNTTCSCR